MLTEQIKAYPFWQYGDDPNIRLFFEMFNAASQDYLDWANDTSLAYYPALSGSLLQWVAAGLYGVPYFSALESPLTPAIGPLNTTPLNTIPLNSYTPPSETYYQVPDDVFKRIITWNFYKGDGRRFSIRWLKRRIMRFLVGTDGIDPQPWNDGFVVGAENTQAISVQFSGSTCTISINALAISAMVQLTPNILPIFAAAFMAPGVLEKPVEWTYVVDIATSIQALVSPLALSITGASATESTGNATVSVLGGSGSYTYAWTWLSGGSRITIGSPSAYVTGFSASTLTAGQTLTGVAQCEVTDTVSHETTSCAVSVSIARVSLPTATPSPTSINASGTTDTVTSPQVMVTAAGGGAPYSFLWSWQSGGNGIGINSPNTSATTFTAVGLESGDSDSGVALCIVTDIYGQQTSCTVPVELSRATAVTAVISPSTLSVTGASANESTGTTTVTASNGVAPYNYAWSWQSGGAGISIDSPTAAATAFTSSALSPGTSAAGTALCTVTDSIGQQANVTCAVSLTRVTQVSASSSPSSQSSTGQATTQTTGVSTVSASGGSGTYSYAWSWASGGGNLSINSISSAATSFTASGMTAGNTYSGVAQCKVTDGYGQTTTCTVSVSVSCVISTWDFDITGAYQGSGEGETFGYAQGGYGSGTGLTLDGYTITTVATLLVAGAFALYISGFSASPGAGYFNKLTFNGTVLEASAATFSYDDGVATWFWTLSAGSGPWNTSGSTPFVINF